MTLRTTLLVLTLAVGSTSMLTACSKKKAQTTPVATVDPEPEQEPVEEDRGPKEAAPDAPTPAPPPPPREAELAPVVYFEFDSSTLSESARAELQANAEWLQADPRRRLTIEGHTDEVGTTEYNLGLSERRARAAKDYLVRLGIAASRIELLPLGEEKPASSEDSENRRAMFVATGR